MKEQEENAGAVLLQLAGLLLVAALLIIIIAPFTVPAPRFSLSTLECIVWWCFPHMIGVRSTTTHITHTCFDIHRRE